MDILRRNAIYILAILIVLLTFLLLHNPPLNEIHGRSDSALISAIFICFSLFISVLGRLKLAVAIISIGYPTAFIIALLFNTTTINHETGNTNNLWIIWLFSCWIFIGVGIILNIILKLIKSKNKKNT